MGRTSGSTGAPRRARIASAILFFVCPSSFAATVTLEPAADNTLYESASGSLSNGAGAHLFAGRTALGALRRALIRFDVATAVPPGSTIQSVTIRLSVSLSPPESGPQSVSLHRVSGSWGEGDSDAGDPGGSGSPAATGDATWLHRFSNTVLWIDAGGDFDPMAVASAAVDLPGFYTFGPTEAMRGDVQSWLDAPAGNHGWILIGNEAVFTTARRFDSKDNTDTNLRPLLTIDFTAGTAGSGRVPDGSLVPGVPLTIVREANGDLRLAWGASCAAGDDDYAVYEGSLSFGGFASHLPRACTTSGLTTLVLTPSAASSYYLIVPRNASREGSYGMNHLGIERPVSAAPCLPQEILATCP